MKGSFELDRDENPVLPPGGIYDLTDSIEERKIRTYRERNRNAEPHWFAAGYEMIETCKKVAVKDDVQWSGYFYDSTGDLYCRFTVYDKLKGDFYEISILDTVFITGMFEKPFQYKGKIQVVQISMYCFAEYLNVRRSKLCIILKSYIKVNIYFDCVPRFDSSIKIILTPTVEARTTAGRISF